MSSQDEERALGDILRVAQSGMDWAEGSSVGSRLFKTLVGLVVLTGGGLAWANFPWGAPACIGCMATAAVIGIWVAARAWVRDRAGHYARMREHDETKALREFVERTVHTPPKDPVLYAAVLRAELERILGLTIPPSPPGWEMHLRPWQVSGTDPHINPASHLGGPPT